jgi:hypothetical protein
VDASGAIQIWRESLLEDVLVRVKALTERFPWEPATATWFLITGEVPAVAPIEVALQLIQRPFEPAYARISLHVEPWVPPQTVARVFRERREDCLSRDIRCRDVRRLELFAFVQGLVRKRGSLPPWPDIRDEWNQSCKASRRYHDAGLLSRDYRQAKETVLRPPYRDSARPRRAARPRAAR